jgi:hypothetical protein
MVGQLILIACGCALLAVGYYLLVTREKVRRSLELDVTWFREMVIPGILVKVTEFCPPGMAYLVDPSVMGLRDGDGQKMLVIHPKDYRTVVGMRNL